MSDYLAPPTAVVDGCDAPEPRPVYLLTFRDGQPVYGCRCVVCSRCGRHTGNTSQGHYWRLCSARRAVADRHHFCCPGACELDVPAVVSPT